MMNSTFPFVFASTISLSISAFAETVEIAGRQIPIQFDIQQISSFDTNLIVREFTRYCNFATSIQDLFLTNGLASGETIQMSPSSENGPPVDVAPHIQYSPPPMEKIMIDEQALQWILSQQNLSSPYTNAWIELEAFLSEVSSCAITNDLSFMRTSFVVDGDIWTSPDNDDEIRSGIATYWSKLHFYPPGLLAWRMQRLKPGESEVPVMALRCDNRQSGDNLVFTVIIAYVDGRWRFVLFH